MKNLQVETEHIIKCSGWMMRERRKMVEVVVVVKGGRVD